MTVNKVILVGRLGKDPELRFTQNQNAVCSFSLATSERRKDASTGEWTEQTEWHNINVWGKPAENCAQFLKKGSMVYLEGRIQTRKWQDKEGKDRYTTEIIANTVQFLSPKSENRQGDYASNTNNVMSSLTPADALQGRQVANGSPSASVMDVAFDEDDIPF